MAEDSFIDVLAAGFDAGIRYDERLERDMIAIPIGPRRQRFVVAAAPAYLAAPWPPDPPERPAEHACIRHRFASGVTPPWEFEREGETLKFTPNGPLITNTLDMEISAAVQGLGLIFTFEGCVGAAIAEGALEH